MTGKGKTYGKKMKNKTPRRCNPNLYPSKELYIENYTTFSHTRRLSDLSFHQLNKVLHLHGFFKFRGEKSHKEAVHAALSEIGELETPHRTTLNDVVSVAPNNNLCTLSLEEVNTDLELLQWNNEGLVRSLHSHSSTPNNNNNDDVGNDGDGQRKGRLRKRVSKEKEEEKRVVFDAIHLTKPRTKKCRVRRKCFDDIGVL